MILQKLLLQCSVRELHNDLYCPILGLGNKVTDDNGDRLVSDTMFRSILPPELRPLTNRYKEVCCCELCQIFHYIHSGHNSFRSQQLHEMEREMKKMPDDTPSEKEKKAIAKASILFF